jgi:YafQ family addiction module toxin component
MYRLLVRKSVETIFLKLVKKNPRQVEIIYKKINEIRENPQHYKNLKKPLQHLKRVHVDSNFVMLFSVNETSKTVIIEDYNHHDKIYRD